jgi:two-component system KDP operon response regulator KdpE
VSDTEPTVLVVDDEPHVVDALRALIEGRGYRVRTARDGAQALELFSSERPDVVLLDLAMPRTDGVEVCRRLRTWSRVPILVLSARTDERQKVLALDAGADDYVTKPVGIDELLARLRAVMRRTSPSGEPVITIGELVLDLQKRSVSVAGEPVHLTPHQYELLRLFALNEGKLLTHRTLLQEVWGPGYDGAANLLHVNVSQLRRKIEPDRARPRYLLTEAGAGYRLVDPETAFRLSSGQAP